MRIGLINIEPKIVNTALMQIAQYHRSCGRKVEWAGPNSLDQYDRLYCSSLFTFTQKDKLPRRVMRGGTGFSLTDQLPKAISQCNYDYSIYPDCKFSIVWFSRGCIRRCPFCVVRTKEGKIHAVNPKPLNPKGELIKVQDNNFFANPEWPKAVRQLLKWDQPVRMTSGIDLRLFDDAQGEALRKINPKWVYVAWDNPRTDIIDKLKKLIRYIPAYRIFCYVLIGYWSTPEEDMHRIETLRSLGVLPYVMPYDKKNTYQKRLARWANCKQLFNTVSWEEYSPEMIYQQKKRRLRCQTTHHSN